MEIIKIDQFLRSMKQNMDTPHALLLGAGASIESGVPSASDCIWEWKKEIFISQNIALAENYGNIKVDSVRNSIQNWLDSQNIYPIRDSDEEYSFYAERAYMDPDDRRKYFQHLIKDKQPSLGYHLIAMLAEKNMFKSIWTTNFDGLMVKCAHQYNVTPIEITLESAERISRNDTMGELLCIALHGDYKYGELKNTSNELDVQNDVFTNALTHELVNHDMVVIGYSGRDKSLMQALKNAYKNKGTGKLFWCGYGNNASKEVEQLIDDINDSGRIAYYVSTDGFDKTIYSLTRHCMSDNKEFLQKVEELKGKLGSNISISSSKFTNEKKSVNKVVGTNIFPIGFTKTCFQFEIKYDDEKPWEYCKMLMEKDIMAIPYNGMLFAWGEKENIQKICGDKINGAIMVAPFTRENIIYKNQFKELLIKTIVALLGKKHSLEFSKDKIWDPMKKIEKYIGNKKIIAFEGVRVSLVMDYKHTYISLVPTYMYEKNLILTFDEKKQFADYYSSEINKGKPNYYIHKYINDWADRLFGKVRFVSTYPIDSKTGFDFVIVRNTAVLGVDGDVSENNMLSKSIDEKRIVFNGMECREPQLNFFNISQNKKVLDYHPMRGLINNAPIDYILNDKILRPNIKLGVICPQYCRQQFYSFINNLNCNQNVNYNMDYVIPYKDFFQAFNIGLDIPTITDKRWLDYEVGDSGDTRNESKELGNSINRRIEQLNAIEVDVVLIYIPREYEIFIGYDEENEKFNLHDFVKAFAAQKNVSTQFVRQKTIDSDMNCQIMWALSLAIYVKSGRVPWTVSGLQNDTAFAGIGYSVNKSKMGENIVVGCSHIYSSDGQGMKYKLSKINDVTFDRKKNPFLSENEAYRLGLNIKELFYKSFTELPKRVVIHKRTPFKKEEIKGLTESLFSAGIKNVELLEITYEDDFKCFEYKENMSQIDGFPVRRGLCFPLNDNTMYIFTHGIVPSIRNPYYKYIQGGKTLPLPLKVVKHYGNGTMTQIGTEILGLSKMNWNSFALYSKLPCTIESSNEIARIGWLLSQYEGTIYDYRFFM